jgi:hypothetical protein
MLCVRIPTLSDSDSNLCRTETGIRIADGEDSFATAPRSENKETSTYGRLLTFE